MDILLVLIALVVTLIASANVKSTYKRYSNVSNANGLTADEVARRILDDNGLQYVQIEHIHGNLNDHYDPRANVIRLSDAVYGQTSVAAIGINSYINNAEITERNIPEECAGEYTQSLMDLGARICIPKHPRCAECPIADQCEARVLGIAAELPHKKKKQPPQVVQRYVMVVQKEDKVLLVKRTEQGVLSGMWEFPGIDMPSDPKMASAIWKLEYGMHMDMPQRLFSAEHIFSHIHWMMDVHLVKAAADPVMEREWRWVNKQELEELMIPTAFRAIRKYVMEEL